MRRIFTILFLLWISCVFSQSTFDVLFYNVENLFDNKDDTLKNDAEFLPSGDRHWSFARYSEKLKNVGKVLTAAGGWSTPALIGLCEIENRRVLNDLVYRSSLQALHYKIIHQESLDRRGIDVALLYQSNQFKPIKVRFYPHPTIKSRDILYVKGLMVGSDTLHLFVNHWPSRYGGAVKSEPLRRASALLLRSKVDSLLCENSSAYILIMGDFNDYPNDVSMSAVLGASETGDLVNLALLSDKKLGSYKHYGRWGYLDQIIVSQTFLHREPGGWHVDPAIQRVICYPFMMEEDAKFTGAKPKRTWIGYQYHRGFSDHLPVLVHLQKH